MKRARRLLQTLLLTRRRLLALLLNLSTTLFLGVGCVGGGGGSAGAGQAAAENLQVSLHVSTFSCDATPPLGHPLCGGWIRPLEAVDDPLLAKGIVLKDAGGTYVLCSIDWCELRNDAYDLFRDKIATAAKTSPSRVAVQCIHAHNAPFTDARAQEIVDQVDNAPVHADLEFLEETASRVARSVEEACERWGVATHVGTARTAVHQVASSRRVPGPDGSIRVRYSSTTDVSLQQAPEGKIDRFLRTVSLYRGAERIVDMHYYATHPQSYYGDGRATCDFPGIARQRMEEEVGVFQLYFTGCAGDIGAGKYNDGRPERREELTRRIHSAMRQSTQTLERQPVSAIRWSVQPVRFPTRKEERFSEPSLRTTLENPEASPAVRLNAALALSWLERVAADRPIELTSLALGKIRILHLPGEPFVDFQLRAQQDHPDLFLAVAAYADCGMGYICSERSYAEGGYEPTASLLAPTAEHYLHGAIDALLSERTPPKPVLKSVRKIWDVAPHSAFTDLIRFREQMFCTFREGAGHVSPDGNIRILVSSDGERWESSALLTEAGVDLRDPKLSMTPDGDLMLTAGWTQSPPDRKKSFRSCVAFSKDGSTWSPIHRVLDNGVLDEGPWLWRLTWHKGSGYGIAYDTAAGERAGASHLFHTRDARTYDKLTTFSHYPGLTEATLRFDAEGTAYCVHRRDAGTRSALLGTSQPPYTTWNWKDTGFYFGGPNFVSHNGTWWAAGRWRVGPAKTVLARVDWHRGTLEPALQLPSGGDTSYPGLLSEGGDLWMSYYASHEGKTAIYLARIGFE